MHKYHVAYLEEELSRYHETVIEIENSTLDFDSLIFQSRTVLTACRRLDRLQETKVAIEHVIMYSSEATRLVLELFYWNDKKDIKAVIERLGITTSEVETARGELVMGLAEQLGYV
jgi:RinA family phage transcriptional activator